MKIAERIADCDEVACEVMDSGLPWYTSTRRVQAWQENFAAWQFSWFVSEMRRVGEGDDLRSIIRDQLRDWDPFERPH